MNTNIQENYAAMKKAYALTPRQLDLLATLVSTGSIHESAAATGISYTSARNALAELKLKLGVATVPMLIGLALDLAFEATAEPGRVLRRYDVFSLTERQYAIARNVGIAKSRQEIAAMLRVSEAVVAAEIKEIHLILGVRNAGELVRAMAITNPIRESPAEACDHDRDLPVATVTVGARKIGYSDFGPADGDPVFILHSTITSRAPPTRLVAALHRHGYRPLAIDRPGFGDTDPSEKNGDPFALAAHDTAAVCAALGLSSVTIIARGAGHAAMRLAQLYPALVRSAVLINPTPAIDFTTIDRGPLGSIKRLFARRPWAVEAVIRMLAAYAKPQRLYDGMLRSFRESPPDFALVRDDPQFAADYLRAVRGFAEGKVAGYVAEQSAWGAGYDVDALPGMTDWRIVQGRHFILHDPEQAMTYWRAKLPDTPVIWVEEAGQMLAYSHAEAVVDAIPRATETKKFVD